MGKNKKQTEERVKSLVTPPLADSKERGSSLVETAFLVALIAGGCLASIKTLGDASNSAFEVVEERLAQGGIFH